jgi:formylglycine-generating enzyme
VILTLLLTPILTLPVAPQKADGPPPPGLVALKGGRATIGSSVKEIEALVEGVSEAKTVVRALDAETPQHKISVAPFYMGLTEVTNEQYGEFVRATGYRPPLAWADAAIEEGRLLFFKNLKDLRDQGKSVVGITFDAADYWEENWEGKTWAIAEGDELRPVTRVDYRDAMAYCRWAGLRLPTEFEYQFAAHGSSSDPFPWGEKWEDGKYCASLEMRRVSRTFKVGHFPDGASRDGLLDLAGNVWEWTQSPYVAFKGFKKNKYKIPGTRKKFSAPQPSWDGNQRVVVGGSYENSKMVVRCTVRRGADRDQMTNALGFRIAGTPTPARDLVEHVWNMDLRNSDARQSGVDYDLNRVMGWDRWNHRDGAEGSPKGYKVITGYEYFVFTPASTTQMTLDAEFRKASRIEPQALGFLTLSMPVVEPAIAPGIYMVAFRAKGDTVAKEPKAGEEDPEKEAVDAGEMEDPLAGLIDMEKDNILIFHGRTGELVAHMTVEGVIFAKTKNDATFAPVNKKISVDDPAKPGKKMFIDERWLRVKAEVLSRSRGRVLPFSFDLKLEPEFWDKKWRKKNKKK